MSGEALIVEDDLLTGELLGQVLRRRDYAPTLLREGRGAVAWAREHRPELVLLDLGLPDVDGNDVCEELKFDRRTNLIPVIMITGRTGEEDRARGLRVGANYYLTKPFEVEQLNRAIEAALAWREGLEHRGTEGEIHFHLPSDTRHLEELNGLLASLLLRTCLEPRQIRQLTTAVREMGTNAIEWGHRKQVERQVTVTYRIDPEKVTVVVRDTGPTGDIAHDKVSFAGATQAQVQHILDDAGEINGDTYLFHNNGADQLVLKGVQVAQLSLADFAWG